MMNLELAGKRVGSTHYNPIARRLDNSRVSYLEGADEAMAAATTSRSSSGTMMPPEDDVPASTTAGSMTGSTMPPAKAVVAATDKAAARAIFFIMTSR